MTVTCEQIDRILTLMYRLDWRGRALHQYLSEHGYNYERLSALPVAEADRLEAELLTLVTKESRSEHQEP